jgi:PPOX class probable F420-dependent enzyme
MTGDEISALLDQASPALIGVVATVRADGSPHAVPVWYSWHQDTVHIWTHHERGWVRNLHRDRRVAFTAQQAEPPYGAVSIRGAAETSTAADDIDEAIRRIVCRYLPENERQGYIAAWSRLRTIVRIHPVTIRGWSRGY